MENDGIELLLRVAPADLERAVNLQSYLRGFGVDSDISLGVPVESACIALLYDRNWMEAYPETPEIKLQEGQVALVLTEPGVEIPEQWAALPDLYHLEYYEELQLCVCLLVAARIMQGSPKVKLDDIRLPRERFYLGVIFAEGVLLGRDIDRALAIWRKAAEEGDPDSAFQLALRAYKGVDGEVCLPEALRYFRMVGPDSDLTEGYRYKVARLLLGQEAGMPVRREEGLMWLRRAAEEGDPGALRDLEAYSET